MTAPENHRATILLAEDDEIDAEWVQRCIGRSQLPNSLIWALDGEEALRIVEGVDDRGPLEEPALILLDLNMPRMDGLEFLEKLRQVPRFADTPVVVLTTSTHPMDRTEAERHRVCGYLVKPLSPEQLVAMVDDVERRAAASD